MPDAIDIKKIKSVPAVINNERVECAKCGSLLMKLNMDYKGLEILKGTIKCNHRHQGERCGAMNDIYI